MAISDLPCPPGQGLAGAPFHGLRSAAATSFFKLTHVLRNTRGHSCENLQRDVGCCVCGHGGFEAAAGVEVAVDGAGERVEDEDSGDEPGSQFAEAGGEGQVAEGEEEGGDEDGGADCAGGGVAFWSSTGGAPEFAEGPGEQCDEEETCDEFFGDAAVEEAGEEALPEGDVGHPLCEVEAGARQEEEGVEGDENEAGGEADDGGECETTGEAGAR